jgi:hypothetical protein
MPDTGIATGQEPTSTETPAEPTATEVEAKPDPWAGIPEEWAWTKAEVESARTEAASRRVALREAEAKLAEAKTPEEFTAAMDAYKGTEAKLTTDLARERAARKFKLDDDVLEFLTGTDEAQIEAQAAKLAALKPGTAKPVVITQTAPSGGAAPFKGEAPTDDGRKAWEEYKRTNRR